MAKPVNVDWSTLNMRESTVRAHAETTGEIEVDRIYCCRCQRDIFEVALMKGTREVILRCPGCSRTLRTGGMSTLGTD